MMNGLEAIGGRHLEGFDQSAVEIIRKCLEIFRRLAAQKGDAGEWHGIAPVSVSLDEHRMPVDNHPENQIILDVSSQKYG
jgi:hypothetical protein